MISSAQISDPKVRTFTTIPPRHRFKNPFTMSKTAVETAYPPNAGSVFFSSWRMLMAGGAYRDRTDDPLLAKQVLSQLS